MTKRLVNVRSTPARTARGFFEALATGLIGGLLFGAAFVVAFGLGGRAAFLQRSHGLSLGDLVALLIGAGLAMGAVAGIAGPFVNSRTRAMLIAIAAVAPLTAVFTRMIYGPVSEWNGGTIEMLILCSVVFGIMGGNIHWSERRRRG